MHVSPRKWVIIPLTLTLLVSACGGGATTRTAQVAGSTDAPTTSPTDVVTTSAPGPTVFPTTPTDPPTPTTSAPSPAVTTSAPPANTPPSLNPWDRLVDGTDRCVAPGEDAISVAATADDLDGVAKVTGSFREDFGPGDSNFSPPTPMTRRPDGVYVYPSVDLRAGTYTFWVSATDTKGLTRTATTFVFVSRIQPTGLGLCSVDWTNWTFKP
jgi:hypothetical protein